MNGYIYIIKNKINNKVYIGQTSRTIYSRFQQHINNALRDEDDGMILYEAIRKYGKENFYVEELECVEIKLLSFYNCIRPNGYNIREGGDDPGRKEVYQIDIITNKIIKTYPSASQAADENNLDLSNLTKTCRHECGSRSCGGYKWSYAENYDESYFTNIKTKLNERPVYQVSLDAEEVIKRWNNIRQASLELNIPYSSINLCVSGKVKSAGGFQWCDIDKIDKIRPYSREHVVLQYNKNNVLIKRWNSANEAAHALQKEATTIRRAASGKRKSAYGYIWKYEE